LGPPGDFRKSAVKLRKIIFGQVSSSYTPGGWGSSIPKNVLLENTVDTAKCNLFGTGLN